MANKMRYRYGDTNTEQWDAHTDSVIEVGDLVYWVVSSGVRYVRCASDQADAGTIADNQGAFHDLFVGVAMGSSASGETDEISVATTGVFEYDAASDQYLQGELVGPNENAGGTGLEDQEIVTVATAGAAIGRVAEGTAASSTTCLVRIKGYTHDGAQEIQTT